MSFSIVQAKTIFISIVSTRKQQWNIQKDENDMI